MYKPLAFETLRDADGQVTVGWAGDSVVHARAQGGLSGELGLRYANHVQRLVANSVNVHFFGDVTGLTRYDLIARSAFVRMALANRRRFETFTFLLWPAGVSPVARAFAEALGGNTELIVDADEFHRRLLRVAPLARQRLDPTWIQREAAPRQSR